MSSTEKGSGRAKFTQPAVLCDFDDTTAVENVAELVLEHFSDDSTWAQLKQQFRDKTITFTEYQEGSFRRTTASREAMQALVKAKASLRPHFKELWQYCQSRGIPLAIVTVGLDFYVEALLEREGLADVPRHAVSTSFSPQGITFEYPNPCNGSGGPYRDVCATDWGNCKCRILLDHKKRGHTIFYVGDGRSDFCPASLADRVFAHGLLAQLCQENQVPFRQFTDFGDVISGLKSLDLESAGPIGGDGR